MSIVPSGSRRNMEAQHSFSSFSIDIGDPEMVRALKKQAQVDTDLLSEEPEMSEKPIAPDEMEPQPDAMEPKPDGMEPIDSTDGPMQTEDVSDNSLRKHIFKMLESIGVPPRTLDKASDKVFKSTEDLTNGTISGFYMIPTYTANGEVGEKEAKKIAQQIGSRFGLIQKLESSGQNYKITFSSGANDPNEEEGLGGTSFDRLLSGGDKAGSPSVPSSKAASTLNEMIKDSRLDVLHKLSQTTIEKNANIDSMAEMLGKALFRHSPQGDNKNV